MRQSAQSQTRRTTRRAPSAGALSRSVGGAAAARATAGAAAVMVTAPPVGTWTLPLTKRDGGRSGTPAAGAAS